MLKNVLGSPSILQKLLDFQAYPDYSIDEALRDFEEMLIFKEPEEKAINEEEDLFEKFRGSVMDEQLDWFTLGNNIFKMILNPEEESQEHQNEVSEPKYVYFALDNFTLKQRNSNLKPEDNKD